MNNTLQAQIVETATAIPAPTIPVGTVRCILPSLTRLINWIVG